MITVKKDKLAYVKDCEINKETIFYQKSNNFFHQYKTKVLSCGSFEINYNGFIFSDNRKNETRYLCFKKYNKSGVLITDTITTDVIDIHNNKLILRNIDGKEFLFDKKTIRNVVELLGFEKSLTEHILEEVDFIEKIEKSTDFEIYIKCKDGSEFMYENKNPERLYCRYEKFRLQYDLNGDIIIIDNSVGIGDILDTSGGFSCKNTVILEHELISDILIEKSYKVFLPEKTKKKILNSGDILTIIPDYKYKPSKYCTIIKAK